MDSHLSVFFISAFSFVVAQASKPLDQYGGCFSDEGCAGHQTQSSKPSEIALGGDAHLCTIIVTHNTNTERGRQSCVYILVQDQVDRYMASNFLSEHQLKTIGVLG